MIYVIEFSSDGGKSWQAYQSVGFYRHPERCEERASDLQASHARLPSNNRFHGYLFRATPYVRKEH